jgi:hypothetical protein
MVRGRDPRANALALTSAQAALGAIMARGGVTERLMVPLSKSGVGFAHRGFESHPLRQVEQTNKPGNQQTKTHLVCWFVGSSGSAQLGGVLEWPIRHAWRACDPQGSVGSNPTPSASPEIAGARRALAIWLPLLA